MSTTDDPTPSFSEPPPSAGVQWKRFGGMLVLATAFTAGLVTLTAQGVLAANFSISGMPFTVTADHLHGDGFEQFATLDHMEDNNPNSKDNNPNGTDNPKLVMVSAIDKGTLTNLCQQVSLGGINLRITAGDAGKDVQAESLVVDSDLITGNANFKDINVGQDSQTFDKVQDRTNGGKVTGMPGVFGQQAKTVDIYNLRQNNYSTTASTFTLPHLRMSFSSDEC
jgi:hypothetical protein